MIRLSWDDVKNNIWKELHKNIDSMLFEKIEYVYGVPRGGIPVAAMISGMCGFKLIETVNDLFKPPHSVLVVDDIICSGKTRERYNEYPFIAVCNGTEDNEWVEFPWERMINEAPIEDAVVRMIEYIKEDPDEFDLKTVTRQLIRFLKATLEKDDE